MGKFVLFSAFLFLAVVAPNMAAPHHEPSLQKDLVIDGTDTTIALGAIDSIDPDVIIQKLLSLVKAIIAALKAPKFDYWGNVKMDVELLVGSYVNNHSISQVEHFSKDLQELLLRYATAPVNSSTYADKDEQAAVLNMAILSHRNAAMSGDLRFSLILHFEDIASMHLAVLKDAAETYSTKANPSRWYVDLNDRLEEYITYAKNTTADLKTFRMNAIQCVTHKCDSSQTTEASVERTCYDVFDIYDFVTGHKDECKSLPTRTDCNNACADYKVHIQQQLENFIAEKVTPVQSSWEALFNVTKAFVPKTSRFYNAMMYDN